MTAIDEVTRALVDARRTLQLADASPHADALQTPDEAFQVRNAVAAALGWFGPERTMRHWKPGHSPLPPDGVWTSPADARAWPFTLRLIEAEVALRLNRAVDAALAAALDEPGATALVDAMCVSIEVCDSRWQQGMQAPPLLRLADLQSHGALVLGEWRPFEARDWSQQRCEVQVGGAVQEFRGSFGPKRPTAVLPDWLRHATRDGAVLPVGTVVSTGTWCGVLEAQAGDAVRVAFDGLGEARVQL